MMQVDLTEYMEKHEFVFDAVLNEEVSNDEVTCEDILRSIDCCLEEVGVFS